VEHVKRYSLAGLLRTDFIRAVSMTRLKLRERRQLAQNNTSIPSTYMASVPLGTLGAALLVLGAALGVPVVTAAGVAALLGTLVLNRGFLRAIAASDGWGRAVSSIALLWLELVVVGAGTGVGILSYLLGRRY